MRLAGAACLMVLLALRPGGAGAQAYDTMASHPDPRDFMSRDETRLSLLGDSLRFMGYDIGWLGIGPDGVPAPTPLTPFEVRDALATVQALGGTVLRARPVAVIPGCTACAHPGPTHPDPAALAALDLVLKTASDLGLKVIVPLAGGGGACPPASIDPICVVARDRGLSGPDDVFADTRSRAEFMASAATLPGHVNRLTGAAYGDDPTILAWENCLSCGAKADSDAVAAWSEQLGQALKAADPRHLYENGAFAGRIGPSADRPVPARAWATPSVDIVGDDLETGTDSTVARGRLEKAAAQVTGSGKIYVMDTVRWTPPIWRTEDDLQVWCAALTHQRNLSGAVAGRLVGHAEGGGYLPAPPAAPAQGTAALYFPGIATRDMDAATMQARGRALRRLAYAIADVVDAPAYLRPPKPEIIAAAHGRLIWRGAAGAAKYTIERSPDPDAPGTWQVVCQACATDLDGFWQDPAPTTPPAWYRIAPININGHAALPSEPVQSTR